MNTAPMSTRASHVLAASFVATVASSACTPRATNGASGTDAIGGGPKSPKGFSSYPSSLHKSGDRCNYMESASCPSAESGGTCNPPPPIAVECPQEGGATPTTNTPRPAGKEKWLRALAQLNVSKWGCSFEPTRFCPPAGGYVQCDNMSAQTLSCQIATENRDAGQTPRLDGGTMPKTPDGKDGWFYIEGFSYTDVWGKCRRVDARWCEERKCTPDEGVACDSPSGVADAGKTLGQGKGKKECWHVHIVACDPDEKCNPPPPDKMDCPAGVKPGTYLRD